MKTGGSQSPRNRISIVRDFESDVMWLGCVDTGRPKAECGDVCAHVANENVERPEVSQHSSGHSAALKLL